MVKIKQEMGNSPTVPPAPINADAEQELLAAAAVVRHADKGPCPPGLPVRELSYLTGEARPPPLTHLPIDLSAVKQIIDSNDIGQIEVAARVATDRLIQLRPHIWKMDQKQEACMWNERIQSLSESVKKHRSVIGVVGNTGAGKSSLINAVLGVSNLIPTNGMEACTAVATEIMYNDYDDPAEAYRAEIEYIRTEDWAQEINTMLAELRDDNGNLSREHANKESEAGVAYAKIRAVYPQRAKTKELISQLTRESLLADPDVTKYLDQTHHLSSPTCAGLGDQVQDFLASAECPGRVPGRKRGAAVWPLIKVVRIYLKSDALSTGTVLVDLPGVHDSNAARSAVARTYMVHCTSLWIATPITRAVDDQTARSMLSESLRLQLKMDGLETQATIICTKTDDISVPEIRDSLGLWSQFDERDRERRAVEERLDAKQRELDDNKRRGQRREQRREQQQQPGAGPSQCDEFDNQLTDEYSAWRLLRKKAKAGAQVHVPPPSVKRKRPPRRRFMGRKRGARDGGTEDDESEDNQDDGADYRIVPVDPSVRHDVPLTIEEIDRHLAALKLVCCARDEELDRQDARASAIKEEIAALEESLKRIPSEKNMCIKARNGYSKRRMKENFEMIMACEANGDDPDTAAPSDQAGCPHGDKRKKKMGNPSSVPVFCVSSKAYQELAGGAPEGASIGFGSIEDTEMPALQAHAKQSNLDIRRAICENALADFQAWVGGLWLWAGGDRGSHLTEAERLAALAEIRSDLDGMKENLDNKRNEIMVMWQEKVETNLSSKLDDAVAKGKSQALQTFEKWTASKKEGGMVAASFRSTCRRNGSSRTIDFNAELSEPIRKRLAAAWTQTFGTDLPEILRALDEYARQQLRDFQIEFRKRRCFRGSSLAKRDALGHQMQSHSRRLACAIGFRAEMDSDQKAVCRRFVDVIQAEMSGIYSECGQESGKGMFIRIKAKMSHYLTRHSSKVFRAVIKPLRADLDRLHKNAEKFITSLTETAIEDMKKDYEIFITGSAMSDESCRAMSNIQRELATFNADFVALLHPEDTATGGRDGGVEMKEEGEKEKDGAGDEEKEDDRMEEDEEKEDDRMEEDEGETSLGEHETNQGEMNQDENGPQGGKSEAREVKEDEVRVEEEEAMMEVEEIEPNGGEEARGQEEEMACPSTRRGCTVIPTSDQGSGPIQLCATDQAVQRAVSMPEEATGPTMKAG